MRAFLLLLSIVASSGPAGSVHADDFLEQSWIDRRAKIADHEWPIPPPEGWIETSMVHGYAEKIWDDRWTALDRQFGASVRVAFHLVRDGHGRAARAELPVLVRLLGLINAHSRNPGTDKRSARDHALQIAVSKRISAAARSLGRLDDAQRTNVLDYLRELAAAVESADHLERNTAPILQARRRQARIGNAHGVVGVGLASYVLSAAALGYFDVSSGWMIAAPLSALPTALTMRRWGHDVPKAYEPDDRNRVAPLVQSECENLLEQWEARVPSSEPKTNSEES